MSKAARSDALLERRRGAGGVRVWLSDGTATTKKAARTREGRAAFFFGDVAQQAKVRCQKEDRR